ncbi:MAG: peptidylprolyl isomerase, partial [Bacteroidetes bacterium]
AAAGETTVMRADSISFQSGFIPGVGTEPKVLGAAFNKAFTGKVSEPISGATGVFAIRVENISAKPNLGGSIDDQRKAMENNTRQQVGYRSLDALRKAAKVVDNRYNFY